MLETYNTVTLDRVPGVEGDNAERPCFKVAVLFSRIAAGCWLSCVTGQELGHSNLQPVIYFLL